MNRTMFRNIGLTVAMLVLCVVAWAAVALGSIINDTTKSESVICTATLNGTTGSLGRLRLIKGSLPVINIQDPSPLVSGSDFSAASTTALVGATWYGPTQAAGPCQASFDYIAGVAMWLVIDKDSKVVAQGSATGHTITAVVGPG